MLAIAFAALVTSFLATTLIVQRVSGDVDSLSESIIDRSMPRIQGFASLRGAALQLEVALATEIRTAAATQNVDAARFTSLRAEFDRYVQRQLAADALPGEGVVWRNFQDARIRFEDAVDRAHQLVSAGDARAAATEMATAVGPATNRLVDAAMREIEFHARHGRDLAVRIQQTRRRALWLAYGLTVLCVGLGAAGLVLIRRQADRRRDLLEAQARHQAERADELEEFAGRVAHDIRGPLAVALTASEMIARLSADETVGSMVTRIQRGLTRATDITEGLLAFARAGARPDPGARTDVREAVADLVSGVRPEAAKAAVDIVVQPVPAVLARCSKGVYLSLLSNLIRNSIKYMGSSTERRVTVTVIDHGANVRTEVADTGPGIAAAHLPVLFDTYFRGATGGAAGLGLGLATVRRLAEGHDGRVGVVSAPGAGTMIWFELPRSGVAPESSDRAHATDTKATIAGGRLAACP